MTRSGMTEWVAAVTEESPTPALRATSPIKGEEKTCAQCL